MAALALVLAALADSLTFLLMGTAHEANPFAASWPLLALAAKGAVVLAILALPLGRYATRVKVFGALAWTLGAATNIAVLLGGS